jgi:epoxide hydrolase 4
MRIGALQLNVAMAGDGPTVLLLHGFPDSLQLWRMVAPHLLEAGYRVIAVDQRGFGDSDAPIGRAHYSIDVLVEDLATLLRATGTHEPVHVMGHDLGAVVAWRYERIEGAGHWLPLERPAEIAELAVDWFRDHRQRAKPSSP